MVIYVKIKNIILICFVFITLIIFLNFSLDRETEVGINYVKSYRGSIVIDAGHGGEDTGSIGISKTYEKDITLKISLKLKEQLEKQNFKVTLTRSGDVSLGKTVREDILNRVKIINNVKPDLFISIHLNGVDIKSVNGVETYTRFSDRKSYLLGESIQDELSSVEYTKDRGVKDTSERSLGILRNTNVTGVLLELGFITNVDDERYLISDDGQNTIVKCVVNGVLNYLNVINLGS